MTQRFELRPSSQLIDLQTGRGTRDLLLLLDYLNRTASDLATLIVEDAINNGVTDMAPSENAVFDALAFKVPTGRTVSAGGIATGGGALSSDQTITVSGATQANQETGSSTAVAVTPGVQQFHPSAAKFWGEVTVSGGTPSVAASYNVTSITDSGVGDLTVTIATDFSSSAWAGWINVSGTVARETTYTSKAAGSIEYLCFNTAFAAQDPVAWSFGGFGDQ